VTASSESGHQKLNRAIPGWAVDAILLGLSEADARDSRKLWGMCVRIGMSAYRRGWSENDYVVEITRNECRLSLQLMTRRDSRKSSKRDAYKVLRKAWETAVADANNVGCRTLEEIRDDEVELAFRWTDRLTDGLDDLGPAPSATKISPPTLGLRRF
jgi:GH18 family chitinase